MSEFHAGEVTLVTIVAEAIVEARLLKALKEAGAHGWTVTTARGEGPRNRRVGDLEGGNVRIETLVSEPVAAAIMHCLAEDWFPHFAVAAWTQPVQVTRLERYL